MALAWRYGGPAPGPAGALEWLLAQQIEGVLPRAVGERRPSASATAAALAAASDYQLAVDATRWIAWLTRRQRTDGWLPGDDGQAVSRWTTAEVLAAMARWIWVSTPAHTCALRAAAAVATRLARLLNEAGAPPRRETIDRADLECAASLHAVASRLRHAAWRELARDISQAAERQADWTPWDVPLELHSRAAAAFMELGHDALAERILAAPCSLAVERRGCPESPGGPLATSRGLARLAFATFERHPTIAARALRDLRARQDSTGALVDPRVANKEPRRASLLATCDFLRVQFMEAAVAFESDALRLPAALDERDPLWLAVRDWVRQLPPAAQVADVGCGSGRFLRAMALLRPDLRLTGVDPAARLLAEAPTSVARRRGSMLGLPLESSSVDAVLAVESLEHALLPRRAIAELCRVLRPEGRLLIVDKQRRYQLRSDHEPWERWPKPSELRSWLTAECGSLEVEFFAAGERPARSDLFFALRAVRRGAADDAQVTRRAA